MATKKRTTTARRGAAPKKNAAAKRRRTQPGRYKGFYIQATRDAVTRSKKKIEEGKILLAIGDADDGWVPVLFRGHVEFVPSAAVSRLRD